MAASPEAVSQALRQRTRRQKLHRYWLVWKRRPLGLFGLILVLVLIAIALGADILATHDPTKTDVSAILSAPGTDNLLGGDRFGRDMFSRIIYGARISLFMGFTVALGAGIIGGTLGIVSAYFRGYVDLFIQRLVDMFQSIPGLILAMSIVAVLGMGLEKAVVAILIPTLPRMIRITRSQALSVRATDYVLAGQTIGAGNLRLMFRYIMPNSMAPWIIVVTGQLGGAITTEASLSFLGLGVPEPHPSWGGMLSGNAAEFAELAPWLVIFPGVALSLTIFGFNVWGDALRDVLDPRLKGT